MSLEHDIVRRIARMEKRLDNLVMPEVGVKISNDNVSSPPTDAELDTAFPNAYNGFVGLVDDNGTGSGGTVWLVAMVSGVWWYEQLTEAV